MLNEVLRRWRIGACVATALILGFVGLLVVGGCEHAENRWSPRAGLGSYGAPLLLDDGRIDVARTVDALTQTGVDRYYYLVPDRQHLAGRHGGVVPGHLGLSDWEDLPRFAKAAAEVDIEVVVYLVPPLQSGRTTYRPYGWDYAAWFRAVGTVAATHPNIVGIAVDDFGSATDLRADDGVHPRFSPQDVAVMRSAARNEAPWLEVFGVMYGQDFAGDTATFPRFRNVLDGVIYAFAGPRQLNHAPQNTTDAVGADSTIRFVRSVSSCPSGDKCWQVTFPPSSHGPGDEGASQISQDIHLADDHAQISMDFRDNAPPGEMRRYSIGVALDGHALPTQRTQRGEWSTLRADVPESLRGETRKLTVRVHRNPDPRGLAVIVDRLQVRTLGDGARGKHLSDRSWITSESGSGSVSRVTSTQLVGMFYASRLGVERDVEGAADAVYVRDVTEQMGRLLREGEIDGLVAYRLNFSGVRPGPLFGDPQNREVVEVLYSSLRSSPPPRRTAPSRSEGPT